MHKSWKNELQTPWQGFGRSRNRNTVDKLLAGEEQEHSETPVAFATHNIEFCDVNYAYHEGEEVLHHVSLSIPEKSLTALVGPSGSGKSTIAKLIGGFWDVTDGSVRMDGKDLRSIPLEQLYDQVAYVSQDNWLFDDTIMNNIRMGNTSASDEEVREVGKASGCDEFISALPEGYETRVGSGGSRLSGGERQRIAIARAMLKDAPIVILDEATAYIDPENEAVIQRALTELMKDKTVIIIVCSSAESCPRTQISLLYLTIDYLHAYSDVGRAAWIRKGTTLMKYGAMGSFVKLAFAKTAFDYLGRMLPSLDMADYRRRTLAEYKAIVARTPSVGPMSKNMFAMTMYAGAFFIALYKTEPELFTPELIEGLVKEVSYCPLMRKAKEGKSAFTEKEIRTRTEQAAWSREHIDEYPMNWYWYFETVPGKDEYFITHKQCGICKLCAQEGVFDIARHLCAMDYYTFEMQAAVLDRTKTLAYGDDECDFHVMSRERATEIGFVKSSNAR